MRLFQQASIKENLKRAAPP
uniref:Uncharacterized protein n=1 Tax=Anguilla anguilla TaxID=7936 RepID=A0A0E9RFQ5_ANGAN